MAFVTSMLGFIAIVIAILVWLRWYIIHRIKPTCRTGGPDSKELTIAFFHPYCNAGGGGERVLWTAIKAVQTKYPNAQCVVYTGDTAAPVEILIKVQDQFNIRIASASIKFVYLFSRAWVEADLYPFFTLAGQSFGSILLGLEALLKYVPDVYIDSMGYTFTLPLFRYLGGCQVGCYVHYPTISTDMLQQVSSRIERYNNRSWVSSSAILSRIKLLYYRAFAFAYGMAGKCSHIVMVNSSWTKSHIASLWGKSSSRPIHLVYPPCDIEELESIQHSREQAVRSVVSVSQFRPEKDHPLQLKSFAAMLKKVSDKSKYKLVLIGSCRDVHDSNRVAKLRQLAAQLGISEQVDFQENISFDVLKSLMGQGTIGLHTMWNEHFGIGVVECMAAGLIMVAHNSGGPRMDIVVDYDDQPTGFLATTEDEFAEAMAKIFAMTPAEQDAMRRNARQSVQRFKAEQFSSKFLQSIEPLLLTVLD